MGAWGPGNFENDDALDWVGDLAEAKDGWTQIRSTLSDVAKTDFVEASKASSALAAAECVAIGRGKPPGTPAPAEAAGWCARNRSGYSEELRVLALRAVQRVRGHSDLKIVWSESEDTDWDDVVGDLERRLST
ncbi:MAG TPA: DUF4259 domain-containing protein [Planctomycetota bacterium]|nr:DUF4259 domain-containing protein [Planctomycetota bacterium]